MICDTAVFCSGFFHPLFLAGSPDRIAGADTDLPDREMKAGKYVFLFFYFFLRGNANL